MAILLQRMVISLTTHDQQYHDNSSLLHDYHPKSPIPSFPTKLSHFTFLLYTILLNILLQGFNAIFINFKAEELFTTCVNSNRNREVANTLFYISPNDHTAYKSQTNSFSALTFPILIRSVLLPLANITRSKGHEQRTPFYSYNNLIE